MSSDRLYTVARHVARRGLQVCTRLKDFILILEGIIKKIFYERRDYESVDEKNQS